MCVTFIIQSGYRSGSQLSKIILNNTYTLCYVPYTYYFILGLGLGLGLILYYFAELAAGQISTSVIIIRLYRWLSSNHESKLCVTDYLVL